MKHTVLIVSSSRADYGYLRPVVHAFLQNHASDVAVHFLRMAVGSTAASDIAVARSELEPLGCTVHELTTALHADDRLSVCLHMAEVQQLSATFLAKLQPSLVVVLGDRYEMSVVVSSAYVLRIPVAHLAGGDLSYGSLDDGFRHCMSKLSTLHFPTNPASASILRQLGEDPASIFVFGSSSIDELAATLTASNTDPATVNRDRVLISFHPETANAKFADDCIPKVCDLIRYVHERYQDGEIVVLGSNADADAAKLTAAVKETASQLPRARFFQALPREEFLQTLLHARMFVGNSSALLLEAPFLNCPCINVGDRQRGRPRPQCVKDAPFDLEQMKAAVDHVLGMPVTPFSPEDRYFFGSGDACKQVAATIVKYLDGAIAVDKTFHTS